MQDYAERDSSLIVTAILTAVVAGLFVAGLWVFFNGIDRWMVMKWGG